ncbi:MAG: TlpA disulfide reductase family protein [Acidobacteriota bacterium]|nr:TlpA disulfide reductase family protein [Acidobacteriota bacterium]
MISRLQRKLPSRSSWLSAWALVVLVLTLLPVHPAQGQTGLVLPGADGGELATGRLSAGDAVVVVWASWSPRCRDIDRSINQIADRWGGRARVVSISFQEDRAAVREFLARRSISVPTYLDAEGTFSKRHGVTTLPSLLVLRQGSVAYRGGLPADFHRTIGDALGGS